MSFDPAPFVAHIRRENEAESRRTDRRIELAKAAARRLADLIKQADPGMRRVILFGSLAGGTPPRNPRFDIDLALDGGDLYRALDVVEDCEFHVDLVDLRLVPLHVRQRIEESGIVL